MKIKYSFGLFVLSILVLVPFRLYLALSDQNFVIGHTDVHSTQFVFLVVALVLFASLIIMSLLIKNVPDSIKIGKNMISGVFAVASGIAMVIGSISHFASLRSNFDVKILFSAITILLSGLVFIFISNIHFTEKNIFIKLPLLSLCPAIWAATRLLTLFIKNSKLVEGRIDMFEIFLSMLLLLFFFAESRLLSLVSGKKVVQKLFGYGLAAVSMTLICDIPNLINISSNLSVLPLYLTDIFVSIYILSLLINSISSVSTND